MTDKTLEQGAVLYEFDAQSYSLFGKPLETDHVLIVRMEDGRARFTMRELDGSLALGQLQLGAAAAEEILRLLAAAREAEQEIAALRARVAVGMSPALERVLQFAWAQACETDGYTQPRVEADILAVRQQAAQGRKVELGKVRDGITLLLHKAQHDPRVGLNHYEAMLKEMLAEIDAAEGKVAG